MHFLLDNILSMNEFLFNPKSPNDIAKNLVEKYPNQCPIEILETSKNNPLKLFEIFHFVEPNKFYKEKMNSLKYEPNIAHLKLAELEKKGKIKAIITQNIDGLHQKAGSQNVLELHGSVLRNYCMKCGKFYNAECVFGSKGVPRCTCGGVIKPDVVLYEEALNDEILNKSISAIRNADLMIVAGTSLTVYPASGLINFYNGSKLIVINREKTQYNRKGNLVINESLGKIFKEI